MWNLLNYYTVSSFAESFEPWDPADFTDRTSFRASGELNLPISKIAFSISSVKKFVGSDKSSSSSSFLSVDILPPFYYIYFSILLILSSSYPEHSSSNKSLYFFPPSYWADFFLNWISSLRMVIVWVLPSGSGRSLSNSYSSYLRSILLWMPLKGNLLTNSVDSPRGVVFLLWTLASNPWNYRTSSSIFSFKSYSA